jgi:cytochrome c biogenesis protein CcdA
VKHLPITPRLPPSPGRLRYALLAAGVVLLGLAGYVGYVTYPRFHLPSVTGAALLSLAAGAGVAAFFSPCSFPLLVTLLAKEAGPASRPGRTGRLIAFAAAFSAGILGFLAVLGMLIAAGGRGLASSVTFVSPTGIAIRITVGSLLVILGLIQGEVLPGSFHGVERFTRPLQERHARFRRRHPVAGVMLFGFSYLLIAFG